MLLFVCTYIIVQLVSPQNVEVKDFRQSWSNGLAFCAIMHSFLPDKIPYDDLTADDPRKNFTIAFEAAMYASVP